MKEYLQLLQEIREQGKYKDDRTGTGTYSLFGRQIRFDLRRGFPAITTKRLFFKGVVVELLWFLAGGTNLDFLHKHNVKIWDAWADSQGNLGQIYGAQWRSWPQYGCRLDDGKPTTTVKYIDQLAGVIESIKHNPNSRRHVVSAWNVSELDEMALVPCHMIFQFYVLNGRLSCHMYQRSADAFLGVPFNIASYALLTHLIARECGLEVGEYIHTFGDVHIYSNHLDQVDLQLSREPRPLPTLWLNPEKTRVDDFAWEDIHLHDYECHPSIKAPIAV